MSRSSKHYLPPEDEPELIPTMPSSPALTQDDINLKVQQVHEHLLDLKRQQEEIERQKRELEELSRKQREFDEGRRDLLEKLTRGVVILERQEIETKRELEQVTLVRGAFADHLSQVESLNAAEWTGETLPTELTRALAQLDQARAVYQQARVRLISLRQQEEGENLDEFSEELGTEESFASMAWKGFAYSFPLLLLGLLGIVAYLFHH